MYTVLRAVYTSHCEVFTLTAEVKSLKVQLDVCFLLALLTAAPSLDMLPDRGVAVHRKGAPTTLDCYCCRLCWCGLRT